MSFVFDLKSNTPDSPIALPTPMDDSKLGCGTTIVYFLLFISI